MQATSSLSSVRSEKVCRDLENLLPTFAEGLIAQTPENGRFYREPDNVEEHHLDWHQYGIITHTKKVRDAYRTELLPLLESWGLAATTTRDLAATNASSWSRGELLEISIPLHDLGKFCRKHFWKDGVAVPDYNGHEALSREIVTTNASVRKVLVDAGLNEHDIQRVADLAGLHFELGKVRDVARQQQGYTIAFSQSASAQRIFHELVAQHPTYALEIGLWYVIDSMGKISLRFDAQSDPERIAAQPEMETELAAHGLRPSLINALMQYPVNMHVARAYLQVATAP